MIFYLDQVQEKSDFWDVMRHLSPEILCPMSCCCKPQVYVSRDSRSWSLVSTHTSALPVLSGHYGDLTLQRHEPPAAHEDEGVGIEALAELSAGQALYICIYCSSSHGGVAFR